MAQRRSANQRPTKSFAASRLEPLELTLEERAELNWIAQESPQNIARRAQAVLLWARGATLGQIAGDLQVHRSTVRRWIHRFTQRRIAGLGPEDAGRRRSLVDSNIRDAIVRIAMSHPRSLGEPFDNWSLRRLQSHVLRRGLVKHLSVESVRQVLRGVPLPSDLWQRKRTSPLTLSAEQRAALEQLVERAKPEVGRRARIVLARANGLQEAEIAAAVGMSPSSVRYWLRRFRLQGLIGIQAPRKPMRPTRFTPEIRRNILSLASRGPAECGVPRHQWSLRTLRSVLVQRGVVNDISIQHLRRILGEAGLQVARKPLPAKH